MHFKLTRLSDSEGKIYKHNTDDGTTGRKTNPIDVIVFNQNSGQALFRGRGNYFLGKATCEKIANFTTKIQKEAKKVLSFFARGKGISRLQGANALICSPKSQCHWSDVDVHLR